MAVPEPTVRITPQKLHAVLKKAGHHYAPSVMSYPRGYFLSRRDGRLEVLHSLQAPGPVRVKQAKRYAADLVAAGIPARALGSVVVVGEEV